MVRIWAGGAYCSAASLATTDTPGGLGGGRRTQGALRRELQERGRQEVAGSRPRRGPHALRPRLQAAAAPASWPPAAPRTARVQLEARQRRGPRDAVLARPWPPVRAPQPRRREQALAGGLLENVQGRRRRSEQAPPLRRRAAAGAAQRRRKRRGAGAAGDDDERGARRRAAARRGGGGRQRVCQLLAHVAAHALEPAEGGTMGSRVSRRRLNSLAESARAQA
jgi:hypothetical protein